MSATNASALDRCVKGGTGTTAFADGVVIEASEFNCDFDAVFGKVDGQLDNDSIVAAAGIAISKLAQTAAKLDADIVDDYSTNEAEQATVSDPGTSEGTEFALAGNLQTEIAQLRFKIEQLTVGTSATLVASADGTDEDASWIDGPHRPGNLIYNGGFDVLHTLAIDADGDGWTRVVDGNDDAPTTLAAIALVESEGNGDGNALQIIDTDDALSGVYQTLDGLKAETKYELIALVQDDVGKCGVRTVGADTAEIELESDDEGGWQVLAGTFETDSTPANVAIQLLAIASSDNCSFKFVGVYEINTDPLPRGGKVHCYDSTAATSDGLFTNQAYVDATVSCAVTPPGPGYMITVRARITAENSESPHGMLFYRLREDCGAAVTVDAGTTDVEGEDGSNDDDDLASELMYWVNDSPVPGATCTYTIEGAGGSGVAFSLNDLGADVFDANPPITWIDVMMEPTG